MRMCKSYILCAAGVIPETGANWCLGSDRTGVRVCFMRDTYAERCVFILPRKTQFHRALFPRTCSIYYGYTYRGKGVCSHACSRFIRDTIFHASNEKKKTR